MKMKMKSNLNYLVSSTSFGLPDPHATTRGSNVARL
jgi:hypothetical protein